MVRVVHFKGDHDLTMMPPAELVAPNLDKFVSLRPLIINRNGTYIAKVRIPVQALQIVMRLSVPSLSETMLGRTRPKVEPALSMAKE